MKPWVLVSPASKGIGLAIAKRILQTTTCPVIMTARTDPKELKARISNEIPDLDKQRLEVLKLDYLGKLCL
jgi:short-subunit dehydrogenase